MKPVSPVIPGVEPETETVYAKDQPEYLPLPTLRTDDGAVLSRWELTDEEIQRIIETRSIYLTLLTFNQPLQPIMLGVEPPEEFTAPPPEPEAEEVPMPKEALDPNGAGFHCKECGAVGTVKVPPRLRAVDIKFWLDNQVLPKVQREHMRLSPGCAAKTVDLALGAGLWPQSPEQENP